jgi:hypothetical protein
MLNFFSYLKTYLLSLNFVVFSTTTENSDFTPVCIKLVKIRIMSILNKMEKSKPDLTHKKFSKAVLRSELLTRIIFKPHKISKLWVKKVKNKVGTVSYLKR